MKENPKITPDGITVYLSRTRSNYNQRRVTTEHPFFSEPFIAKITEEKIIFTKPAIDYSGKTLTPFSNGKNRKAVGFGITGEIEPGYYPFDTDESDEDQLVIYL